MSNIILIVSLDMAFRRGHWLATCWLGSKAEHLDGGLGLDWDYTATAIPFIYSSSGISAASAPISTFMCL